MGPLWKYAECCKASASPQYKNDILVLISLLLYSRASSSSTTSRRRGIYGEAFREVGDFTRFRFIAAPVRQLYFIH